MAARAASGGGIAVNPRMEISYRLKYRDLWLTWASLRRFYKAEPYHVWAITLCLIFPLTFLVPIFQIDAAYTPHLSSPAMWHETWEFVGSLCAGVFIIGALNYFFYLRPMLRRQILLRLSPECVLQNGVRRRLTLAWSEVQAVARESDGLSIYGKPNAKENPMKRNIVPFELPSVVHVPRHAFESASQEEEFSALAQRYWQAARFNVELPSAEQVWPPPPRRAV